MGFLFNVLAKLLPTASVDQIVRVLSQVGSKLAAVEAAQNLRVASADEVIAIQEDVRAEAAMEAERARRQHRSPDRLSGN